MNVSNIRINGQTYNLNGGGGGGGGLSITKLWENPSPSSSMADQDITLSDAVENYDYIGIVYVQANGSTNRTRIMPMIFLPVVAGLTARLQVNAQYNYQRTINNIAGNKMHVGEASYFGTYGNTGTTTNNQYCIPRFIYGFKE